MAGKTNVSDYRFSIFINNDQAKRSLLEMEKTMMGYEADLKRLEIEGKKNSAEYVSRKEAITQLNASMVNMRKEAGLQALSLKELKSLQMQLRNELARAIPGSEHRMKLEKEFNAVTKRLNEVQVGAKNTGMSFSKMADGFNKYFAIVTAGIAAFSGLAFSIKEMITAQGELDDSLANIRKSTGMTATEVQNLNKELGKIDTRTSRQDLRQMAVVAGQLGMAKQDVFAFVESVDKLNVALGDEFTGGAEEVAKQMGMLRNVLTDSKTANVADDMMRVGNAINTLGAAGFATGPVMTDFASRIGGIGIPLGLTSDEVLGMSATLQELNVNAERGGTAVVKIMQKMTTNTKAFAGVAGMPIKEFTNLVNTDLYGAFLKVIEGSNKGGTSATALAGIIKELEISGVGASEIFAKLGSNTGMLAEKVSMAGNALQGTDSVMNEFNIKNATLGAVLAKLKKDFYNLITMPGVTEFFKTQVYHVVELVNWFKNLPQTIEKYKVSLIIVTGAIGVWIAAMTRSLQVSLLNNLTMKEGIMLKIKDAVVLEYLVVKEQMLAIWKGNGTVATKLATTAQWLWNAAMSANPIGLVIAGVTALVGGIMAYQKYNSSAIALDKLKASTTVLLANANSKLENSYSQIETQVRKLSLLSAAEKKDLQDKIDLTIKSAEAELMLMEAKQKAIGKEAAKPTGWQNIKANFKSGDAKDKDLKVYSFLNQKEATEPFDEGIKSLRSSIDKLKNERQNIVSVINAEAAGDIIVGKLAPQLEEKLKNYQVALKNYAAGSEEYNRIQGKIKDTNKELQKYNDAAPGGSSTETAKTKLELLNKAIADYVSLLETQVEKEPKKAAATAVAIAKLKEQKKAIEDLVQTYLKVEDFKIGEGAKAFSDLYEFRKNAGIATADEIAYYEIWKLKETTGWAIASEEERAAAILKIRKGLGVDTPTLPDGTPIEEWTPDNYAGNKQSQDKSQEDTINKGGEKGALGVDTWGPKAQKVMDYANTALSAMSSVDQAMSAYENAQLQKDENANNKKKDNLKKQLDSKKITQKQYDSQIAKMDLEMDAKKKELMIKQAKRQKALSLVQAIIGVAQGVVAALSAGPIIGIILAALVGILGAVQIGYIASTPIPEAAKGRYGVIRKAYQAAMGRYDVLGQDDKKEYRGVPYMEQPPSGLYSTPTLFAETGREIILNPKHTENLMKFRPDLVDAIMQVPQRAGGLYPDSTAQRSAAAGPTQSGFDEETLQVLREFTAQLKRPIESTIVYETMRDAMDTVAYLEKNAAR